jgi:hypothetical protein
MRLLKLIILLLAVASARLVGHVVGEQPEPGHASGAAFRKGWQSPAGTAVLAAESKALQIDSLGPLGELPSALEVDADVLEDAEQVDEQALLESGRLRATAEAGPVRFWGRSSLN